MARGPLRAPSTTGAQPDQVCRDRRWVAPANGAADAGARIRFEGLADGRGDITYIPLNRDI